eukprot:scaffold549_cov385-Prasinococcus_capsulatus_cf.AAC.42
MELLQARSKCVPVHGHDEHAMETLSLLGQIKEMPWVTRFNDDDLPRLYTVRYNLPIFRVRLGNAQSRALRLGYGLVHQRGATGRDALRALLREHCREAYGIHLDLRLGKVLRLSPHLAGTFKSTRLSATVSFPVTSQWWYRDVVNVASTACLQANGACGGWLIRR